VVAEKLVDRRAQRDDQGPGQAGGGVQPADRVGRPPQAQGQPDGGVAERERLRVDGPLGQRPEVSGRVTARVPASPATQQPKVVSHNDQAEMGLVRGCILTV
jgi:hypothetical protein